MVVDGVDTGFSVDLLNAVADQLGRTVTYDRKDSFADILGAV
jgi:ABC-type amino acid transport substrate-binding protein